MGWSCTREVSNTLEKLEKACVAQTGSQNVFKHNDREYFFEVDRKEYDDGSATGDIHVTTCHSCQECGTFKIEPDGKLTAPAFMQSLLQSGKVEKLTS